MTDVTLPAPLVPADVDLRDFAFMPLDVVRLRDSDLAAMEPPEACWAAVLLWCASWHQVPAASLPDDDRVLSNLAGFGRVVKEWQKLRTSALRGWVPCADGRLYHPVVAEKARDAWRSKLAQRWKTECHRVKKHNQRHNLIGDRAVPLPDLDDWINAGCPQGHPLHVPEDTAGTSPGTPAPCPPDVPRETATKGEGEGEGEGQGQGQGSEERESPAARVPPAAEAPPPPPPAPPPPPSAPRPAKKCPAGFAVTPELRAWAEANHPRVDLDFETAKFRDHTFGTARIDWAGTWRNWIRKATPTGAAGGSPQRQSAVERQISTMNALTGRSSNHARPAADDRDGPGFVDVEARVVP